MAEYYYSDDLNQALREQQRIPLMDDEDRKKIQFIVINADGSARSQYNGLRNRAQLNGKFIPVIQDNDNKLIASISGSSGKSTQGNKDHMALIDKHGRILKYFTAQDSYMGNKPNDITRAVEGVLSGDLNAVPLCPKIDDKPEPSAQPVDPPVEKPKCAPVKGKQPGSVSKKSKVKDACECHEKCGDDVGFNFRIPKTKKGKLLKGRCMCLKEIKTVRNLKGAKKWMSQKY